MPPVWKDDILKFNVPKVAKSCLVEMFDDNALVGSHTMKI
jgi:hypothetical protein